MLLLASLCEAIGASGSAATLANYRATSIVHQLRISGPPVHRARAGPVGIRVVYGLWSSVCRARQGSPTTFAP